MKMKGIQDLTGKQFGYWKVIRHSHVNSYGHHLWHCKCICGTKGRVTTSELRSGISRSCGCVNQVKMGLSKTKEGRAYIHMLSRCYNEKDREYHNYGGRGIKVCDRWKNSFELFYKDMGKAPPRTTIDRMDNNGGYSPENCRWATNYTQSRNRRNNYNVTYNGKTLCLSDWAVKLDIPYPTLRKRLKYLGWTVDEAFSTPPGAPRKNKSVNYLDKQRD